MRSRARIYSRPSSPFSAEFATDRSTQILPKAMQSLLLTTLLTLLTLVAGAGWHMTVNYSDGVTSKFHGHINSGCTEFKKTDAKITSVDLDTSLLADTFVLYLDSNCQSESYKGKKGGNNVPNQVYRSYKVY